MDRGRSAAKVAGAPLSAVMLAALLGPGLIPPAAHAQGNIGACCFPDGSCQQMLPGPCAGDGGVFMGSGTSCATAACCDISIPLVVTNRNASGPGSLGQAIIDANECPGHNTILFDLDVDCPGVVFDECVIGVQFALPTITDDLTIEGPPLGPDGKPVLAIASTDQFDRILRVEVGATVHLNRLEFRDGRDNGGAIRNAGTLFINDCFFFNNAGILQGGAIYNAGILTVMNSEFKHNFTESAFNGDGAAIFNEGSSPLELGELTVVNCTFLANSAARQGGAIDNRDGSALIMNSRFHHNQAVVGGAIRNSTSLATPPTTTIVIGSDFVGNRGLTHSGAIDNRVGALTVTNCTFSGNSANPNVVDGLGGAIRNPEGATMTVTNCTFAHNSAWVGGGIYSDGAATVRNTLMAGNRSEAGGDNCAGFTPFGPDSTHNMADAIGCWGDSFTVRSASEIRLGALANNGGPTLTHALLLGSAAIDAGSNAVCAASPVDNDDQRGFPRPVDGHGDGPAVCDIGAYEYQAPQLGAVFYVDVAATGAADGTSWENAIVTLTDALATAAASGGVIQEIWVAAGAYMPDGGAAMPPVFSPAAADPVVAIGTLGRTATFQLISGVAIYGGFAGWETSRGQRDIRANRTILSGDLKVNDLGGLCTDDWQCIDQTGAIGVCIGGRCIRPVDPNSAAAQDNAFHVVTGSGTDATAVLDGFIIMGGNANDPEETGDEEAVGGGMFNDAGSPAVRNCWFLGNYAHIGGGMTNAEGSNPTVEGCVFEANAAGLFVGAMANLDSSPLVSGCTFRSNSAVLDVGGVWALGGSPLLVNCAFLGNMAGEGSTGGGLRLDGANAQVVNGTFTGNTAGFGGGVYLVDSSPAIGNCVVWGNTDTSGTGTAAQISVEGGSAPVVNHSIVQGGWTGAGGVGVLDADPGFVDPSGLGAVGSGAAAVRLCGASPAIDAGDNDAVPPGVTTDVEGRPRFVDDPETPDTGNPGMQGPPVVDMGAHEYQALPFPGVIFVDAAATGANHGGSWSDAFVSLQDALTRAAVFEHGADACDGAVTQIWVAAGTYRPDVGAGLTPGDREASFALRSGVALYGGFAGSEADLSERDVEVNPTILSGDLLGNDVPADFPGGPSFADNSHHVVTGRFVDESAVLDGFTITGGNADGTPFTGKDLGGGMYNLGLFDNPSRPTVRNCTFIANAAHLAFGEGAGMYNEDAAPTVTNCAFIGNVAAGGAGMSNNWGSDALVVNCRFEGNVALFHGGGMGIFTSSPHLINCTFSGNTAAAGGSALATFSGSPGSHPTLTNCSFSANISEGQDGALHVSGGTSATITNCIIWGNVPVQNQLTGTLNPVVNYSIVQGGWSGAGGVGVMDADPLFVDPSFDNLRLLAGSPAIDAGDNDAVPEGITTDLDGNPRFVDDPATPDTGNGTPPIVDMGAYEFQADVPPCIPPDLNCDGAVDEDDFALFAACLTGPAILYHPAALPPGCDLEPDQQGFIAADFNRDGSVDQTDFAVLQRCFSGEGIPADPTCAD